MLWKVTRRWWGGNLNYGLCAPWPRLLYGYSPSTGRGSQCLSGCPMAISRLFCLTCMHTGSPLSPTAPTSPDGRSQKFRVALHSTSTVARLQVLLWDGFHESSVSHSCLISSKYHLYLWCTQVKYHQFRQRLHSSVISTPGG